MSGNNNGKHYSKKSKKKNDNNVRKIIIAVAAILLIAAFAVLIGSLINKKNDAEEIVTETAVITEETTVTTTETTTQTTTEATTTEETTTTTPEPEPLVLLDSMKPSLETNPDSVGWLHLPGTNINSVIVQGEDNDYYLNHSIYGSQTYAGSLYMDFRCVVNDYDFNQSDNLVIYGHNQKDGSMFGTLQYYKVKRADTSRYSFYLDHPTFTFSNLYEEYTYKIVAVFINESEKSQSRDGVIFDAHNFVKFNEKRTFEDFVDNINKHTAINTGVDMQEGDKFITLSTCSNEFNESRFIVIGRRVRDGESPEVDTSLASINENAIEPDLNYILYGN